MTLAADLAKEEGAKILVYTEIDDSWPADQLMMGNGIICQFPGYPGLYRCEDAASMDVLRAIGDEARASGNGGWRKISIIVDNGVVTVERGPKPGPIDSFGARLKAEVERVFGEIPTPTTEAAE